MPIDIVCRGWERITDSTELYPDDLPAEWRLSYFANALGAVYLPVADWADRPEEALADWHDDVHSGFQFFLESPSAPEEMKQAVPRARRALGNRLAGLIFDVPPRSPRADDEPRRWHRVPDVDALASAQVSSAAHGEGLALQLPASADEHPRTIRQRLEALRRHCGPVPLLLVLEPPCAGTVLRWRTIAELLGWHQRLDMVGPSN